MNVEITFNEETQKKIEHLGTVLSFLLEKEEPIQPQQIVKAALYNYLGRFYDNITNDELDLTGLSGSGTLRNNLKEYTESRGITLTSLSEQTGVSKSVLSKTLNNQTEPTLDVFLKIWIGVGCPPLQHVLYRDDD